MRLLRLHADGRVEELAPEVAAYCAAAPGRPSLALTQALAAGQAALMALGKLTTPAPSGPAWAPAGPPPWAQPRTIAYPEAPRPPAPPAAPATAPPAQPPLPPSAWDEDDTLGLEEPEELQMADPIPPHIAEAAIRHVAGGPPPPPAPRLRAETNEQRLARQARYRKPVPPRPGTAIKGGVELG